LKGLVIGRYRLGLGIESLQTLVFVAVVFGNQATTYMNRTRQHLWSIRPSPLLILSSAADVSIASTMAGVGIAMAPLSPLVLASTLVGAIVFGFLADLVKVPLFRRLAIA